MDNIRMNDFVFDIVNKLGQAPFTKLLRESQLPVDELKSSLRELREDGRIALAGGIYRCGGDADAIAMTDETPIQPIQPTQPTQAEQAEPRAGAGPAEKLGGLKENKI